MMVHAKKKVKNFLFYFITQIVYLLPCVKLYWFPPLIGLLGWIKPLLPVLDSFRTILNVTPGARLESLLFKIEVVSFALLPIQVSWM